MHETPLELQQSKPLLLILVHPISQLFTRLEVGYKLAIKADGLAGFRIASNARRAIVQGEAAKTTDLDAIPGGQALRHLLKHGLDSQLHILG